MNQEISTTKLNKIIGAKWLRPLVFVPSIGMLYGILLFILGAASSDKSKIIWGIIGFLFSPLFYIIFFVVFDGASLF